jgi:hypothetical protein
MEKGRISYPYREFNPTSSAVQPEVQSLYLPNVKKGKVVLD